MENMLIIGRNPVYEAIISDRNIEYILVSNGKLNGKIHNIMMQAKNKNIAVKTVARKKLDALSNGMVHQGIIAVASPIKYSSISEIVKSAENRGENPVLLILDGIEDVHNFGAIVRTAECMGIHGIIVSKRRCATIGATVQKTSVGAIGYVKIAKVTNLSDTIENLKKMGFWIFCTDMNGKECFKYSFLDKTVLIIGSEGKGASRLIKEKSDFLIKIPMFGKINSLNASVATGMVTYEVMRQRYALKQGDLKIK